MKICKKCNKTKTLSEFHSHKTCKFGVRAECKDCHNLISAPRNRKYVKQNPEKRKSSVLKNKYGITLDAYRIKLASQGNVCKICGSSNPGASKDIFSVDHNHKTGEIRGLLCHGCNAGLGMFKEDERSLESAIRYLRQHNG